MISYYCQTKLDIVERGALFLYGVLFSLLFTPLNLVKTQIPLGVNIGVSLLILSFVWRRLESAFFVRRLRSAHFLKGINNMKCKKCGFEFDGKCCPNCGAKAPDINDPNEVSSSASQTGYYNTKTAVTTPPSKTPFYKKWWFWVIVAVVFIAVLSRLSNGSNNSSGDNRPETTTATTSADLRISPPKASSSLSGKKVDDVVQLFRSAGFDNIITEGNGKLILGFLHSEGDVESISIGGETEFSKKDLFDRGTKVIIRYYSYQTEGSNGGESTTIIASDSIEQTTNSHVVSNDTNTPDNTTKETEPEKETSSDITTEEITTSSSMQLSYTTNDKTTAKNGNAGVYSYKKSGIYDLFFIIDFDEGYVYRFTEGNGDGICDKVKIVSGTLNDTLIFTYKIGEEVWSNALHFKFKNQPDHLVLEDHEHYEFDFYSTNLDEALRIKGTKVINDYSYYESTTSTNDSTTPTTSPETTEELATTANIIRHFKLKKSDYMSTALIAQISYGLNASDIIETPNEEGQFSELELLGTDKGYKLWVLPESGEMIYCYFVASNNKSNSAFFVDMVDAALGENCSVSIINWVKKNFGGNAAQEFDDVLIQYVSKNGFTCITIINKYLGATIGITR